MPPTNLGNNTIMNIYIVKSLNAKRNSKKYGIIDENTPLVNLNRVQTVLMNLFQGVFRFQLQGS
jgi:hypothetical protein